MVFIVPECIWFRRKVFGLLDLLPGVWESIVVYRRHAYHRTLPKDRTVIGQISNKEQNQQGSLTRKFLNSYS
jgi:hypothetical protein